MYNHKLFNKQLDMSIINSNQDHPRLPGHRIRNKFISNLSNELDFHLYGRNKTNIKQYKGTIADKATALNISKYTFNCENSFERNYFTEKIWDGILSECLTFYDGCPNITDFLDERAYVKLDLLHDMNGSKKLLLDSIKSGLYEDRKKYILEAKHYLVEEFNLLNITWKIINGMPLNGSYNDYRS